MEQKNKVPETAQEAVERLKKQIRDLIKDDKFVAQYTTFPKYRTALLRKIAKL